VSGFYKKIAEIRAFLEAQAERIRREDMKIALSSELEREFKVLKVAPSCPYRNRLFTMGFLGEITDRHPFSV
jgi:hypothetical protein